MSATGIPTRDRRRKIATEEVVVAVVDVLFLHHEGGRGGKKTLRALYDFDAESGQELSFREGDVITLIKQIDANWYEGELHGRSGIFPTNYVEMM